MTPEEASLDKNSEKVYENLFGDIVPEVINPKFKEKDRVLISIKKGLFEKEATHKWSKEHFIISEVLRTNPPTYHIVDLKGEDILGSFYEEELQFSTSKGHEKKAIAEDEEEIKVLKRRTVRGQKQAYVEWADGKKAWLKEEDVK